MTDTTTRMIYAVVCDDVTLLGSAPYDALYGYQSSLFASREDAEARAAELSETGDWCEDDPPSYSVEELSDVEEAEERFPHAFRTHGITE